MPEISFIAPHVARERQRGTKSGVVEEMWPRLQLVACYMYPPDFGGGQLRVHKTLVRMRDHYPVAVEVLAFAGPSTHPGWSNAEGIPVRRLPAAVGTLALAATIGWHFVQARRRGVNLVYIISPHRMGYLAAFSAKMLQLPLIVEIVNCNLLETRLRRVTAGLLTRAATLVVAISQPVAREIRALGVDERRIWVRPNPVDITRHHLVAEAVRAAERSRLGYSTEHVLHLLAGGLERRKNHFFAVDAIERLGEAHRLLFVGPHDPAEPDYPDRLRERIAASPARDRIQLVDRFTDELHRVMYTADCLWMPSLEEGLGNVMLEALCCGVPCVINRALGMDEHVQDGVNGRQAPLDPAAWAEAVESVMPLAHDPDRRRAISDEAQQRYNSASFDAEFYKRILAIAAANT